MRDLFAVANIFVNLPGYMNVANLQCRVVDICCRVRRLSIVLWVSFVSQTRLWLWIWQGQLSRLQVRNLYISYIKPIPFTTGMWIDRDNKKTQLSLTIRATRLEVSLTTKSNKMVPNMVPFHMLGMVSH